MQANSRKTRRQNLIPIQFAGDVVAWATWLYYVEYETQEGAAARLGVSRATVANYINEAKERGLVEIKVSPSLLAAGKISTALKERYGLSDVYVIPPLSPKRDTGGDLRDSAAIAGAQVLRALLTDGATLGVAWGRTMLDVGQVLPFSPMQDVTVMQIAGSMINDENSSPEYCTAMIANKLGARSLNYNAPAIVSSRDLRDQLLCEPSLKSYNEKVGTCDIAIFGVGAFEEARELGDIFLADETILRAYQDEGATGILVGRFIDAEGKIIEGPLSERQIGISLSAFKNIPRRLLVGAGEYKRDAIRAALAGGFCTDLVIDHKTAAQLVA